jgi:heme A synthase
MHWNQWIRQTHRWLSVAFTLVVLINLVAVLRGKYTMSLGLTAVGVLALMFLTGAYLFVLPYAVKWRRGRVSQSSQSRA